MLKEGARKLREAEHVIAAVAAGNHFDGGAAGGAELYEQFLEARGRDLVARRVREHRLATGGDDPADGLVERRPLPRHITGFTADQEFFEHTARIGGVAGLTLSPAMR